MDQPMYNKIYPGKRNVLLNVQRVRVAACVAAVVGTGMAVVLVQLVK